MTIKKMDLMYVILELKSICQKPPFKVTIQTSYRFHLVILIISLDFKVYTLGYEQQKHRLACRLQSYRSCSTQLLLSNTVIHSYSKNVKNQSILQVPRMESNTLVHICSIIYQPSIYNNSATNFQDLLLSFHGTLS